MTQSNENLSPNWHDLSYAHSVQEDNPVITPYKNVDVKILHDQDGITIGKRLVSMKDGTQYWVTSSDIDSRYLPDNGALDGLANYEGVAFTTHPEGMYVQRLIRLGEMGLSGSVFSIPENIGMMISYEDNVNNYLSLTNNEALEHGRDPELVTYSGISQGSMNGTGFIALAPEHNINVAAAHLSVPCLPEGIKLQNAPEHLRETASKLTHELSAIVSIIKSLSKEERKELMPTVDLRIRGLLVQLQMLRSLLSGGAGKYAHEMKKTMEGPVIVELNGLDALSREKVWVEGGYFDKDNIRVNRYPKLAHGSVIDPTGQTNILGFQSATADIIAENPSIRSDPKTAGKRIMQIMRVEYPQFTKPLHDTPNIAA